MSKSVFVLYCAKDKHGAEKVIAQLQSAQFIVSHGTDLPDMKNNKEWENIRSSLPLLLLPPLK